MFWGNSSAHGNGLNNSLKTRAAAQAICHGSGMILTGVPK